MRFVSLLELDHTPSAFRLVEVGHQTRQGEGTEIVLIPPPTPNDPNDPLNWSRYRRLAAYWPCLILAGLANFCVTGLSPAFRLIAMEFHVDRSQLSWLISVTTIGMAAGCFTITPLASKFGKRPVWLGCSIAFLACNIWAAASPSYASLLTARLFAIWAAGASEPLSMDTLKDLFFLHERGTQSGILGMVLVLGSTAAPLICGFLVESKGWRWYHWLVSILAGVDVLLVFFLFPETNYRRYLVPALSVDTSLDPLAEEQLDAEGNMTCNPKSSNSVHLERLDTNPAVVKKSYFQCLTPWSPIDRGSSLLAAFVRPWMLFAFPSLIWTILSFSIHVASFVVLVTVTPLYLSAPPYRFTTSQQGMSFIGAILGSLLAGPTCGYFNDKFACVLARRNNGVFEPEMRLPITLVPMILTSSGLLMFGLGIQGHHPWILAVLGNAFVAAGLSAIPSSLQPYLLDSYFSASLPCFTLFHGFKNLICFAVSFGIIPWIELDGVGVVFGILAGLTIVIDLVWVPFYVWGNSWRQQDAKKVIFPLEG